jgi:hypothetical protein
VDAALKIAEQVEIYSSTAGILPAVGFAPTAAFR